MRIVLLTLLLVLPISALAQINLSDGATIQIQVAANERFTSTNVTVLKGEIYQITADGTWQDAGFPPTDANGFKGFTAPMFFGMLLKPMPSQYYMKLCGKVGGWKFSIGTSATIKMKRTGKLIIFPNDTKGFFDNNHGIITVTIKRGNYVKVIHHN